MYDRKLPFLRVMGNVKYMGKSVEADRAKTGHKKNYSIIVHNISTCTM